MTCKLCGEDSPLRLSHIIPEFLYKSMYDEKHRFHVISASADHRDSMEQKGLRERLLCEKCETRLSRWEDYACKVLTGGVELEFKRQDNVVVVKGIDYGKMKLFQLSVLWRAGISKLRMFERVDLGPHEQTLRKMLFDELPGHEMQYGCVMFGLTDHKGETAKDLIVQPEQVKMGAHKAYRFIFGGFAWFFVVASGKSTERFNVGFLKGSGELMFSIKDVFATNFIKNFAERRHRLGKD